MQVEALCAMCAKPLLASEFLSLILLVFDDATQPLDIGCQCKKHCRFFKTSSTVVLNPVQFAMLQMIDSKCYM